MGGDQLANGLEKRQRSTVADKYQFALSVTDETGVSGDVGLFMLLRCCNNGARCSGSGVSELPTPRSVGMCLRLGRRRGLNMDASSYRPLAATALGRIATMMWLSVAGAVSAWRAAIALDFARLAHIASIGNPRANVMGW